MVDLKACDPFGMMVPRRVGTCTLRAVDVAAAQLILPYSGSADALPAAMRDTIGLDWPAPGRFCQNSTLRCIWVGRDQALLTGSTPLTGLSEHAAVIDQTDNWACAEITGPLTEAVLARLLPIDVRLRNFQIGHCARTLCRHVPVLVLRIGPEAVQLMGQRSFSRDFAHDLGAAMEMVAARQVAS